MRYHFRKNSKYEVILREFKSEMSFKENCKCSLELVNPSVKT